MPAKTNKSTDAEPPGSSQTSWNTTKAGKNWQLAFFRALIRIGGRRPAYHIMYIVVLCYVLFSRSIRRSARPYLDRRFPRRASPLLKLWDSYRLIYTYGRTLIDQAAVAIQGPGILETKFLDEKHLQATIRKSDGAVLVNAHAGVWQIAMSKLDFLDKPVSLVMIPPGKDSPIAEMFEKHMPCNIIDPRNGFDSVLAMLQSLKRGEILGVMGDRVFGDQESTVEAEFLEEKIRLPFSPYRLAGAAGVPILMLLSAKTGYKRYEISLARVIHVDPGAARKPERCTPYANQFTQAMEEFVDKYPWQFFNFYDLWRTTDNEQN